MNKISHDSEVPAQGQQVITACALIHHNFNGVEKVFLAKRADTKKFLPGIYELPGGHIDFGEDPVVGLVREIKEEFGMRIAVGDPFFVFTYTNDIKGSHSIEVVYFAQFVDNVTNIKLNLDDHSSSGWYSQAELPQAYSRTKGVDDIEFKAVRKGFGILNGDSLIH
jgi:8-oxo-dGTP diphosphatase